MRVVFISILALLAWTSTLSARNGIVELDPNKMHLEIFLHPDLPTLEFRDPKKGEVVILLDKGGLFVKSKLVCSWPVQRFDKDNTSNMVLGYSSLEFLKPDGEYQYEACPRNIPIRSTWGDDGKGVAVLFVEIDEIDETRARTNYLGHPLYLHLTPLKGRYRVHQSRRR